MKIEQNVKRSLEIALVFLMTGLLLGSLIVFALSPSSTFYISSGSYPGAPSYTIENEGNNVFAKDANGLIEFSGTNASAIIQNSIDALYSIGGAGGSKFGGTVYVMKGDDYNINTALIMRHRVNFIAEKDTTLKATQNLAPAMISLDYDASTTMSIRIAGFRLEGNNICNYGISIRNAFSKIVIEQMEIYEMASAAIHFKGTWGVTVREVRMEAPSGGYGVYMKRADTGLTANNLNTFQYLFVMGDGLGVFVYGDAIGNSFLYCHFTTDAGGIQLKGNGTWRPTLTKIKDCWFERGAAAVSERGVEITDVSPYSTRPRQTIIQDCHFGVYDIGIFVHYGANTSLINNYFASITSYDINIASTSNETLIYSGIYEKGINDNGGGTLYKGLGWE